MYKVCAHYEGTTIWLEKFDTEFEANNFIGENKIFVLADPDETLEGEEDYVSSEDMFVLNEDDEKDIPFAEQMNEIEIDYWDDLPF